MSAPRLPPAPPPDGGEARSYRGLARSGPDPVTEADAIVELMQRSHALRRRLLMITIAASMAGGVIGLALYVGLALRVYGRVAGFFYAGGAIVTFLAMQRVSNAIARAQEARWSAELARLHHLDEAPLLEAAAMFK